MAADLGVRFEHVHSDDDRRHRRRRHSATIVPRLAGRLRSGRATARTGRATFTYGHYAGRYNETQIAGNTNVGNPERRSSASTSDRPGRAEASRPGFDPANYLIGRRVVFPTANVTSSAEGPVDAARQGVHRLQARRGTFGGRAARQVSGTRSPARREPRRGLHRRSPETASTPRRRRAA